jgi:glucose-1-phosphate cytidylyltransferase
MKVVLFCGGQGMRMRPLAPGMDSAEATDLPKPMVRVGAGQPLIWHVMRYYAHFGYQDFILCLGYRAECIKEYFLSYNEYLTNDFVLRHGGATLDLLGSDIKDWKITFVDTGLRACVGERLKAVQSHLAGEKVFLANYSDGLTDMPLTPYVEQFLASNKVGAFMCVRPPQSTHVVNMAENGDVLGVEAIRTSETWINGGYFVFRQEIFDYLHEGEELVMEPFDRLIAENKLMGYKYDGFWNCIDTFKEKQQLDEMSATGDMPWAVWKQEATQKYRA